MLAESQQCTNYTWLCYKETPEVSCSKNKGHPLRHAGEVDGMTTHSSGLQGKEINYQFPLSHLETSNVFWSRALSLLWPRDISKQSPLVLSNDSEDYSGWPQPSPSALDPPLQSGVLDICAIAIISWKLSLCLDPTDWLPIWTVCSALDNHGSMHSFSNYQLWHLWPVVSGLTFLCSSLDAFCACLRGIERVPCHVPRQSKWCLNFCWKVRHSWCIIICYNTHSH